MKNTLWLVLNDTHHPFHDPELVVNVLQCAKDVGVTHVQLNGDILDCYNISRHEKTIEVTIKLEEEFYSGLMFIKQVREYLPNAEIHFNAGNHEHRVNRYIDNNPMMRSFLRIEHELQLEKHEIHYYPYNNCFQIEDTSLFVQHSPPSYGVNGARTSLLKKPGASFIWGCTHRVQSASITAHNGEVHYAYFNGNLLNKHATDDGIHVFSYAKGHENWQQAFCLVHVLDSKKFFVQQVPINNREFVCGGHFYGV